MMKSFVVIKNVFRRVRQDPRTLMMILATPMFFMVLYGITFSGSPGNFKIRIVNLDNGMASVRTQESGRVTVELNLAQKFIKQLDPKIFNITQLQDEAAAKIDVESGRSWVSIIFPQNFSHAFVNQTIAMSGARKIKFDARELTVLSPQTEIISPFALLYIDNSNPTISNIVLQNLNHALATLLDDAQATSTTIANMIEVNLIYGENIRPIDFAAPGVIGFAITLITIMLTSITIVRERTSGTLTRLLIAPIRAWEATLGYTIAYTIIALFQVAELLAVSHYFFGIRFAGEIGLVILVVFIFTIGLQGIATLLSTIAKNEFQAVQFILIILIPSIMLSGVFWPIESMPQEIRALTWLSPLTYANSALRDVMVRGWGLAEINTELIVLTGFALLMLALSIWSMRKQAISA